MRKIISTLGFDAQTTSGILPKSTLLVAPTVSADGKLENTPTPQEGALYLVNARVFAASERTDFIMFDSQQTVRDIEGKATAQGGYIMRDGTAHTF